MLKELWDKVIKVIDLACLDPFGSKKYPWFLPKHWLRTDFSKLCESGIDILMQCFFLIHNEEISKIDLK